MSKRGVVFVAFGEKAQYELSQSLGALKSSNPDLCQQIYSHLQPGDNPAVESRRIKTFLYQFSAFEITAYLDADTRVQASLEHGFEIIESGFDMALAPSPSQGDDCFWHVGEAERIATFNSIGHVPLQFQCGVIFFAKNSRTRAFFDEWRAQWLIYQGEDQAAFVRALYNVPVKLWLLGRPWNGGAVIQHLFGRCRG